MPDLTTAHRRHLGGLLAAAALLAALGGCGRADTPSPRIDIQGPVAVAPAANGQELRTAVAGLPSPDAADVARQELAYFKNDGAPAAIKVGVVERTAIAEWLNTRQGVTGTNAKKVMWPDKKESGGLTVMAVRADGDLWAPRQHPGIKAEPLAGDAILVIYMENKPVSRNSFTWADDTRTAGWLAALATAPVS